MFNKFDFAKIYKLTNDTTDKIYIGSTCERYLCNRMAKHRNNYLRYTNNKTHKTTASEILKLDGTTKIELLETVICNNLEELCKRERYYIELNKDIIVNKNIPTRTQKERQQLKRNLNSLKNF
jgi:hypothetical protein